MEIKLLEQEMEIKKHKKFIKQLKCTLENLIKAKTTSVN